MIPIIIDTIASCCIFTKGLEEFEPRYLIFWGLVCYKKGRYRIPIYKTVMHLEGGAKLLKRRSQFSKGRSIIYQLPGAGNAYTLLFNCKGSLEHGA